MSETMQGRRVPDSVFGESGGGWETWRDSQPGDYMKVLRELGGKDTWYIRDPNARAGALRSHTVTEHEDGTITARPSILDDWDGNLQEAGIVSIKRAPGAHEGWHGWLERGVWRSV
jgi:hypothetical protein